MKKTLALGMMTFVFMALVSTQTAFGASGYGGGSGGTKRVQKFTRVQTQTPKQVTVQVPAQALNVPKGAVKGAERFQFGKDLSLGATMQEVKELQKTLRAEGFFTYPEDTGYFGQATRAAVVAYQQAHKITPASGYVGPLTRAELNKGTVAPVATTEAEDEVSVETFVELLIGLGVIPADKAEQARTLSKDDGESA